jgi:hypothetical protein
MHVTYRFEGETLKFLVVPMRMDRGGGAAGSHLARVEAIRGQISTVADHYGHRMAEIINERESIRREIGETLGLAKAEEIDRALIVASRVANQKKNASAFAEYRTVVFEPGLSPGQRRLLFDRVVQQLDLPLPRGELQPTFRAQTW